MNEGNTMLLVAVISAISAIIATVASFVNTRKKNSAEADSITSTEWKRLYDEMFRRVSIAEDKITAIDRELDIAKDYIQYLWLGTVENIRFMEKQGMEPPFKPKRNFRGSEDFDQIEWSWLGELGE